MIIDILAIPLFLVLLAMFFIGFMCTLFSIVSIVQAIENINAFKPMMKDKFARRVALWSWFGGVPMLAVSLYLLYKLY